MVLEHLYKTNRVIGGTSSADSIIAYEADRVTIRGLEGNDSIYNNSTLNLTPTS